MNWRFSANSLVNSRGLSSFLDRIGSPKIMTSLSEGVLCRCGFLYLDVIVLI